MEGLYDIHFGGQTAGTAKVSKEGLYYRFDCQCRLAKKEIFKICIACGEDLTILGTPLPDGDTFNLRTRLPAKRFAGKTLRFFIEDDQEKRLENFIPVKPDEPLLQLKDLKNAVFCVRNGVRGIIIRK